MPSGAWSLRASLGALLVLAAGCGAIDTIKARGLARDGNAMYRASDYRGAIAKYREALALDPATPNVYLNLGYALFSIYDPQSDKPEDRAAAADAVAAFDQHLVRSPKDDKAKSFRIKILLRAAPRDRPTADKAYAVFSQLLEQNPNDSEARQFLVTLFIDCKWYDKAVQHYEARLREKPDDVETMKILSIIADKSGQTQPAIDWYRRRAEATADPAKQASLFYELGTYVWNLMQYQPDRAKGVEGIRFADQGIEACRRAMALKASYAEAMVYANLLYLKRGLLETSEQARYFDENLAFALRTEAGKILGARKESEAAAAPATKDATNAEANAPAAKEPTNAAANPR
jgi:tetratricopeptide (TPR) repeat protein